MAVQIRITSMIARRLVNSIVLVCGVLLLVIAAVRNHLTHDWTVYAPGFSESAWKQVTNAMPVGEVQKLLGSPFGDPGDNGHLIYSQGKALFFRQCMLRVSHGIVVEKRDSITSD
jgi:hypothetical protein